LQGTVNRLAASTFDALPLPDKLDWRWALKKCSPLESADAPTGVDQVGTKGETMGNRTIRLSKTRAVTCSLSAIAILSFGSSAGLAAGDGAAGQQFFATHCTPCHATEPGVNKAGPPLAGIVGRKSGTEPGYSNYSQALKAASITWDENTLDKWLQDPTGDVHGSRMFIMVPNAGDRQNVIAYLETLK
jgi:cytochrome c